MPKKDFNASKIAGDVLASLGGAGYLNPTFTPDNETDRKDAEEFIRSALQAAHDAGRNDLNGRDMIDTLDAGAVEFLSDHAGKVWLNVDGRCLFRAGKTESVKVDITRIAGATVADTVELYGEPTTEAQAQE